MTTKQPPDLADGASAEERERKERVLHTRVPEVLAEELKKMASAMRVPVSNVVRTVLEDAVDAVSSMGRQAEGELMDLANRLANASNRRKRAPEPAEPEPAPAAPLAGVIGFQPLVLAADTVCSLSGRTLRAGDEAFMGVRAGDGPLVIVAPECVPVNVGRPNAEPKAD